MELIKDLPEVFEEFAEQRQKSFLAVKELKRERVPVVGSYCTYFPKRDCNGDGGRMRKAFAQLLMRQFRKQRKIFRRTSVR